MDPMKILLVDDSKSARYALRLQLQRHGVEVETADSAESAFEVLKGPLPDAILMDHTMPGMNGFEALEVIREDPRTAHLPVVMCTSHEDADFAAAAHRKGVAGILPKSVAPEKLPDILTRLRQETETAAAAPSPVQEEHAQAVATAAPAPASQPAGISQAEVVALVDAQINTRLDRRLDERVEARINAVLDDLRRDLTERLMSETRRLLDAHLDEERRAREAATPAVDQRDLDALADRLTGETLPDLMKIEMEAERAQVMELVEQYLREVAPRQGAPREPEEGSMDRFAELESSINHKAQEAARGASTRVADAAIERIDSIAETLKRQLASGLTRAYVSAAVAALAGLGAAAAVYLLSH